MKRLWFFVSITLFFATIFISFASAITPHPCLNGNETILSLYDYNNSHGALWNDTVGTSIEICYNEIFGVSYAAAHTSENVHQCLAANANRVLTLSSIANAHANGPGSTPYPVPVCYGDLVCTLKNSACSGNEREVVSLSSPTNAHIEMANQNKYNYRVCCTSAFATGGSGPVCGNGVIEAGEQCDGSALNDQTCTSISGGFTGGSLSCNAPGSPGQCQFNTTLCTGSTPKVTEVHWEDSSGLRIGRSVGVGTNVNKTVRAVASSTFTAGTAVSFLIKESDLANDDTIRTVNAQTDGTGKAVATFKITDADISAGDEGLEGGVLEFYFVASAASSSNQSEIVDVSETAGPNTPPIANITAPVHRGVYYNGTTVLFNQSSIDAEGGLTYNWTIAEDNYKDTRSSFSYLFKTPGIKTITLRVNDDQGLWDEQEVSILVVASPGMLAYVNKPFQKQIVPAQSNGVLSLNYAANESYVINNNIAGAGTCNTGVTCLAGPCPLQTQNSPAICGGGPVPINGAPKTFANTTFNWTIGNDGLKFNGVGDAYSMSSRIFPREAAGSQTLSLILSFNNTVVGISQTANRAFTMGQCVEGGHTFIRINVLTSKEVSRGSTNTPYCTGQDLVAGTNDDCCPAGFACGDPNGGTNYKCYGVNITSCSQYSTSVSCSSANPNIVRAFPEYTQNLCGQRVNDSIIDCKCDWTSSCFLNVTSHPVDNCGTQGCDNPPTSYQCSVISYTQHECINGYADVDIVREFIPGTGSGAITDPNQATPPCVNETITGVLCGRPAFDLDFAPTGSIIAAALLIGILYALFYSFKKQ